MERSPQYALASLLPLLLAGEASAALAFRVLGRRRAGDPEHLLGAVRRIGDDEQRHERLLRAWQRELPQVSPEPTSLALARQYFSGLASSDAGLHFARIAAVDSAVCQLLGALRRVLPLAHLGPLWQIARDEARHVVVARDYALALTRRSERLAAAAEARDGLVRLLTSRSDSIDLLGLDVDALLKKMSGPPPCFR